MLAIDTKTHLDSNIEANDGFLFVLNLLAGNSFKSNLIILVFTKKMEPHVQ